VRDSAAGIDVTVYRGPSARHLLETLIFLAGPPPTDLSITSAISIFVGGPDAEPEVIIHFYDAAGCVFYAASTNRISLDELLSLSGEAA